MRENYFEFRLHASAWEDAENDDKCRALVTATRLIDRLNFAGLRTADYIRLQPINWLIPQPRTLDPSSLPGQNFEFPRNGSVTIPQDIMDAACEIALALLDGVDPELEMQGLGTVSQRFAAARHDLRHVPGPHGLPTRNPQLQGMEPLLTLTSPIPPRLSCGG